MARTALTKVTSASFGDGIADAGFEAVDQANGNSFTNTGKTILIVTRSGGTVQPTFALSASKYTANDAITKTPAGAIADGNYGVYGPFSTAVYGSTVNVDYDTGVSVTAAVIELADTPL